MFGHHSIAVQTAIWQTAIAVIQAVVSIALLVWYVLSAHLERRRVRRERSEDFESLVTLCRDLGVEAKDKTKAHLNAIVASRSGTPTPAAEPNQKLALWKADMTVVYVCLNEVPHYEVRNPAFSTALTRLWLAVDARSVNPDGFEDARTLIAFLTDKFDRICIEIDAMAGLLTIGAVERNRALRRGAGAAKRRGHVYMEGGLVKEQVTFL